MTHNATLLLRIVAIIIGIAIIGGYAYNRTKEFARGPTIEVTSPLNGAALTETTTKIRGVAKNISYISLNGKQIFTDEDGNFNETLLLYSGYNIITIHARDRFERFAKSTTHLTVTKPPATESEKPKETEEETQNTEEAETETVPEQEELVTERDIE